MNTLNHSQTEFASRANLRPAPQHRRRRTRVRTQCPWPRQFGPSSSNPPAPDLEEEMKPEIFRYVFGVLMLAAGLAALAAPFVGPYLFGIDLIDRLLVDVMVLLSGVMVTGGAVAILLVPIRWGLGPEDEDPAGSH